MRRTVACLALIWLALTFDALGQQILIDQGARVGGLWCFPSAVNPSHYYYIPMSARLARDEAGDPVFSFLRYVINEPAKEGDSKGITSAEGGGILTVMVTYDTPQEVIDAAESGLKRLAEDDAEDVVLRGPVIFKEGRYLLVSSILTEEGDEEKKLLTTGSAPVFEGNEVAFSFDVTPEQSKLLLESFKMATPDISFVFDMTFTGLTDAYDATLEIDWSEVSKNETFGAGVGIGGGLVSADIEKGFEELRKNNAIKLQSRGANPNLEALLAKVHTKLLNIMFKKQPPEKKKEKSESAGILESLLGGLGGGGGGEDIGSASRNLSAVSFSVKWEKKELKKSGKTTLHFNSQTPADRNIMMVANIGDLYERYNEDQNRFRTVNLADPAYQQREIHVGIDGTILPEFDKYINSVTVTLRKVHENGAQTVEEVIVDRNTFNRESRDFRMIYGWNDDNDRDEWLAYDYRTRWSFKGGGLLETDWTRTETNMIDLYAPYRRNTVELIGDAEALKEQGVRAVAVIVEYDFFDGRRSQELAVPTSEEIDGRELEITLPLNVYDYDYTVTWLRRGKKPLVASGTDDTGVIFVDDLPKETASAETGQ